MGLIKVPLLTKLSFIILLKIDSLALLDSCLYFFLIAVCGNSSSLCIDIFRKYDNINITSGNIET